MTLRAGRLTRSQVAALPRSNAEESLATLIRWERLPEPAREYRFAPPRRWRFDFAWYWMSPLIAVEVDGGSFTGGHRRGVAYESDCEKFNEAALLGWTVLRVTPRMIDDGRAIALIKRALA